MMIQPADGILLIAEPFLKDPPFMRSVVLLCRYSADEGAFGFTIHRKLQSTLDEIVNGLDGYKIPVFYGGPVQADTLHFIHQYPNLLLDSVKITENVYWGGDFDLLKNYIKNGTIEADKIKFFLGYSGWDADQLEGEIEEKSWITLQGTTQLIFNTASQFIWQECLNTLGGKYQMMVHFPTDPQLN